MDPIMSRSYALKTIQDTVVIVILGMPLLILNTVVEPYHRGFNCDDESIRYPYKESTIPSYLLYIYGFGIPIISIIIIEFLKVKQNLNTQEEKLSFIWRLYCELVPFAFGLQVSQLITDTAKYSIGRLRPHFYEVCNPDIDCRVLQEPLYKTEYRCNNMNSAQILDARLSFMSGHASFSAFCMTYTVFYIQHKTGKSFGLIKKLIQFFLLHIAIYTGFTRISDYKHHWSDVLVGWLQGTTVAILTCVFVAKLHRRRHEKFYRPYLAEDCAPTGDRCMTREQNAMHRIDNRMNA